MRWRSERVIQSDAPSTTTTCNNPQHPLLRSCHRVAHSVRGRGCSDGQVVCAADVRTYLVHGVAIMNTFAPPASSSSAVSASSLPILGSASTHTHTPAVRARGEGAQRVGSACSRGHGFKQAPPVLFDHSLLLAARSLARSLALSVARSVAAELLQRANELDRDKEQLPYAAVTYTPTCPSCPPLASLPRGQSPPSGSSIQTSAGPPSASRAPALSRS